MCVCVSEVDDSFIPLPTKMPNHLQVLHFLARHRVLLHDAVIYGEIYCREHRNIDKKNHKRITANGR